VLFGVDDAVDVHLGVRAEAAAPADANFVASLDHLLDQTVQRMSGTKRANDGGVARLAGRLGLGGRLRVLARLGVRIGFGGSTGFGGSRCSLRLGTCGGLTVGL